MSQTVQELNLTEDGIVISDWTTLKIVGGEFSFKPYESRRVEWGTSQYPINLYPDDPPMPGFKVTDVFGGMGVVCKIHPDDKE